MPIHDEDEILDIALSFQKSRILLAGFELGIFNALGNESRTSAETADLIGCDQKGTDRLMNALCSMGLLEKNGSAFANTPAALNYLCEGTPGYLSGLHHTASLYKSWATLDDAVRAGGTVIDRERREGRNLENFIAAMHRRASRTAASHVAAIDISSVNTMIDIGGGSGVYAMAFARMKESLRAVVFDLPEVIDITGRYVAAEGLSDRVSTMAGNYLTDQFGHGYDLAFMSAIVHINDLDQNRSLVERAVKALNPGGYIVISDHVMYEDRSGPLPAAIFALNMLVNTQGGDTYTESEIQSWFEQSGCIDYRRIDIGPGTAFLIARKPPG